MKAIAAIAAGLALTLPAATHVDAATGTRTAKLQLSAATPVSLRGSKFLTWERVTVVAHSQGRMRIRTVVAGQGGAFLVRFAGLPFDRCQGFLAIARGSRGSVARYKLPDLMCPPS